MNKVFDKLKPIFEAIAANKYVSAIRDGFIACMPIIIFSSIFMMIAYVPNAWGFYWPKNVTNALMIAYNYSMGLLALFVAGTTAKNLTDSKNLELPKTNQINPVAVIVASEIAFVILSILPLKTGVDLTYMGTQGLICAYIVGLIVPNIYFICIKNNVTIKLPPQVPGNISQSFKDLIPMGLSVTLFWLFGVGFKALTGTILPRWIIQVLSPLFQASDSYLGLALIAGAMAFFWFCGVQGPSIVQPAVVPIMIANTAANLQQYQAGEHVSHALAMNTMDYVMNFGGTGSTLVVAFIMLFAARSAQLKAVGKAAFIPGTFSVNEPVLFGMPIIMNPMFFIPFLLTPIVNVCLFKFFVSVLGMNSMMYTMPWTVPAPIGIVISTGFAPLAFVYVLLTLVLDVAIYFPFIRVYDSTLLAEEKANEATLEGDNTAVLAADTVEPKKVATQTISKQTATAPNDAGPIEKATSSHSEDYFKKNEVDVLVLCAGGGTSGILANALNKLSKERGLKLSAAARAYGQDMDLIKDMNMVILAPQMESMKANLKKITDKYGVKLVTTTGRQYIDLTNNGDMALNFVESNL
ncbi:MULTISPECIES: lactose-specific PTS transporter subunit EIIC [Lacticaseibacillus]|uniref:PTS system lactose-specific EIICB component n=3 Tax=Lacticaseibacillus TaxID=2759736 RepID=A0AAN1EY52_LACCA|nr:MULTISPECIES: lactose-specific PTS transporter subunit EIIC [Lacticaseibacillus]ARY90747.1 PTS lactose transporter subunit IIB [Lacticaseibacillus casei]KAB1970604.1 PTS lactose transporter subunit IIB [Lacticaseibacillus casei]WLV81361.1 lactose-specific PTS transporter subunit EIIC [Lacticaseibacillus sp. NCIMB 15473]WNX25322.1 lactose-specific PTS transporter subunit EIIC [Lacticaseibacillus casei]WNX28092.1 lactose-specific PTS transporter subunit EIIC [Lacticaseibacillus casei]